MSDKISGERTLPLLGAIMLPGLCVVAPVLLVGFSVYHRGEAGHAWQRTYELLRNMNSEWGVGVCIAGLGFLIGVVARALTVDTADLLCGRVVRWLIRRWPFRGLADPYTKELYKEGFPYRPVMQTRLEKAQANGRALKMTLPLAGSEHLMFNYWKVELVEEMEKAFALAEEYTGRVRLFASLFWAGLCGCLVTVGGMVACWILQARAVAAVQPILLGQFALCLVVLVVFGWRLRPVRGQEVAHVHRAYMVLYEKKQKESGGRMPCVAVHQPATEPVVG